MASDVQSLLADARALAEDGDVEGALERYAELCEREPYNPDFWLERAGIAESAGRAAEAADMIFHVVDLLAAAGMGEASELAQRILALVPEHEGARSFLRDLGRARSGQPGDTDDDAPDPSEATPTAGSPAREEPGDEPGGASGVVAGMVYDSLPAIGETRGTAKAPDDSGIPRPVTDEVSDGVPVAILDEPSGWSATSVPLPTVDQPSGPVAGVSMREVAASHRDRRGDSRGDPRSFSDVQYGRPRPATLPGIPVIDVIQRLQTMSSPLLDALGDEGLEALVAAGTVHRRRRHEAIFHQGDIGSSLYLVLEGSVDVERHDPPSGTIRRLATLESGAFFGEMSLVSGVPRSATVRAATDVTLFKVSRQSVRELSERDERLLPLLTRFFRARLVGTLMATSPLFRSLSADERRVLITRFKLRELPADRVVLRQGRPVDGLYLVLLGTLGVSLSGSEGNVTLSEVRAGEVFGVMSALSGEPTRATVRTREHVWLLRLPGEELEQLVEQHPEVRETLVEIAEARYALHHEQAPASEDVL